MRILLHHALCISAPATSPRRSGSVDVCTRSGSTTCACLPLSVRLGRCVIVPGCPASARCLHVFARCCCPTRVLAWEHLCVFSSVTQTLCALHCCTAVPSAVLLIRATTETNRVRLAASLRYNWSRHSLCTHVCMYTCVCAMGLRWQGCAYCHSVLLLASCVASQRIEA